MCLIAIFYRGFVIVRYTFMTVSIKVQTIMIRRAILIVFYQLYLLFIYKSGGTVKANTLFCAWMS